MKNCQAVRSHITDSRFYRAGFTTNEACRVFCDYRRLQRWLDVEAALAWSQAELDIIPREAAVELIKTAKLQLLDKEVIHEVIKTTGHSLMPVLTAWEKISAPEAARYIHYGATTQDIQDSAQSLEIKDIFTIINRDLRSIINELSGLAKKYCSRTVVGRTHGQHALPTTFGLKIAVWLDELLRCADRLEECGKRTLVSQLFGGVGTMDALGERGLEILDLFSKQLGLSAPRTAWHSSRDRVTEFVSTSAILAGCLGKITNELCQLSRNEIGELEEPFHIGKIGSSTMPHKRNPELSEQVVVLSKLIKANASLSFDSLINEHERDYRAVRLEWVTVVDTSLYLCGALSMMKSILGNLIIHEEAMERNLQKSAVLISTEALMFLIGEKIGKQKAHQLIYEVSMSTHDTGAEFIDQLAMHPDIQGLFSRKTLGKAITPEKNIGLAYTLTDRVIKSAKEWASKYTKTDGIKLQCPLKNGNNDCSVAWQHQK